MTVRIQLLGPIRAWQGDGEVTLGSGQQQGILAMLALAGGRSLSRSHLASHLWGDDPPSSAANIIQQHVRRLRRLLEPQRQSRTPSRVLPGVSDGYLLRVDPELVDALRLRRRLDRAAAARRAGDHHAVVSALADVVRFWQPPLVGATFYTVQAVTTALTEEWWRAVGWYCDAALACGMAAEVLALAQEAAVRAPLDESAQARLVRGYHATGRRADAFAVFRASYARLRQDLGIDPGAELAAAYEAALTDSAEPIAIEPAAVPAPIAPAQLPARNANFCGRHAELAQLRAALEPDGRQSPIVCLEGIGGVGKTKS